MGQLANLAIMGTWLGQTYIEESEKKKKHENRFLIKYMLQGEIKFFFFKEQKKDQSLLALTFETLNHDYKTEINRIEGKPRIQRSKILNKKKLTDETKLKQIIKKIRVNPGLR